MNRLIAAVAIGMCLIAGKMQTFTCVYRLPYAVSTHIQPSLNHYHMFDNAGFMRRRFADRARRQQYRKMVKPEFRISRKQQRYHHRLLLGIEGRRKFSLRRRNKH